MAGVLGFAAFGGALFALICDIVSVALNYWVYTSTSAGGITGKRYFGLWKICNGINDAVGCSSWSAVPSELAVVRAMVLLALFIDIGAVVCGGLKLFVMKDKSILNKAACGLLIVAGLFLIVGFSVFVAKIAHTNLHAGFAFCIIAWIAAWVAAGLFGASAKSDQ